MAYIDNAFVNIYHDNVMLALQQKGSRLRQYVSLDTLHGEDGYYDYIDKDDDITTLVDDDTSVDTRHPDTVITDPTWTRRRVAGQYLTKAYLIEKKDRVRMLADPTDPYIQNIAYAIGRKLDSLIISEATGTAYTGKDGTTAVDLPTSQIVVHDDKGLTFDKLMTTREILDSNEIDPETEQVLVVNAKQLTNLLNDLASTNLTRDAETVRAIVQGQLDTYMGFKFVRSERLLTETVTLSDGSTTATARDVIVFTKPGILLAINDQTDASIDKRPDKNNATQIFFGMYAGSTRMDESQVVKIQCIES